MTPHAVVVVDQPPPHQPRRCHVIRALALNKSKMSWQLRKAIPSLSMRSISSSVGMYSVDVDAPGLSSPIFTRT